MMRRRRKQLVALALGFSLSCVATAADATAEVISLYVSPTGSDANDGSFASPFQSLMRAKSEVATLQQQQQLASSDAAPFAITVFLRAGTYALTETLEFGPSDSGRSAEAPVTYQAYCDAAVEAAAMSVLAFPYTQQLANRAPRQSWNGVGDRTTWSGPVDPFEQMGLNRSSNTLLANGANSSTSTSTSAGVDNGDASSVCVDRNNVGHTCYSDPELAPCVTGCMAACAQHVAQRVDSPMLVRKFAHLFGKDLAKHDDCVEVCARSCRGCERVTLSGATHIPAGAITTWTLAHTVEVLLASGANETLSVFQADLSPFVPAPESPDVAFTFSTLYVNDTQYPRAGFPDCHVPLIMASSSVSEFDCSYVATTGVQRAGATTKTLVFDPTAFSPRASAWTNVDAAVLELRPNRSEAANAFYSVHAVDAINGNVTLSAGGAELSYDMFENGPLTTSNSTGFRVENVLEELDAPGEWFFDPATKTLFLIPLDAATATATTLEANVFEFPVLRQLVRVSGSRANTFTTAAHATETLVETDSSVNAAHLRFHHLTFSGTELRHTDVYERIPGSSWPMARIAAVFIESVDDIVVAHCTFEKIRGNAVVVSGASDNVQLVHNNISFIGASAIAVLARQHSERNAQGDNVRPHLLYARATNVSFNQIHHVGRRSAHAAAVMSVGAQQTTIDGNLVFAYPTASSSDFGGAAYHVKNAIGAAPSDGAPLVHAIAPITIPPTLATDLGGVYTTTVSVTGINIPVVAKLIGAPACRSGSGRIDAMYGDPEPFTYTMCSGCCSVHANDAKLRVQGAGVDWADATARAVVLRPGETLELSVTASTRLNAVVDVFVGFHVVTPNLILELATRATWQIRTRQCQYSEHTYFATCTGPCAPTACGNSNIGIQQSGNALTCAVGYEPDVTTHRCTGPFAAQRDCDGTGVVRSYLFYDCSISCFTSTCT